MISARFDEENLHIIRLTREVLTKVSGKICLLILLKVRK